MKGEENAHIFLFVSLGGREHLDCRAGCLLTMASEERQHSAEAKDALSVQTVHTAHTHCKVCVCALKLCHHLTSSHV